MLDEEKLRQIKAAIEQQLARLQQEAELMRDMSVQLEQYVDAVKAGKEIPPDELIELMWDLSEAEESMAQESAETDDAAHETE